MTVPEVRASSEFRVAGRTLAGPALVYGDISPEHRERFLPGAFGPAPRAPLNIQHDRAMMILKAGAYALEDSPRALEVRAELPADSAAIKLVQRGALNGFSIEFKAVRESREGAMRVIERAVLVGVAVVDLPSFPGSVAEVRARGGRGGRLGSVRGRIPANKRVECRCGPGDCTEALFESGALDGTMDRKRQRDVLAVVGEYANAIGSAKRRSVRFWGDRDGGLNVAVDIPNTERGRALIETMDTAADVYARPVIDADASDFVREGALIRYKDAEVRGVTIGATDAADGWSPMKFYRPGKEPAEGREAAPARRRRSPGL